MELSNVMGILLAAMVAAAMLPGVSSAAYEVQSINTTIYLYQNTSAKVTEVISVLVTNQSIQQYSSDRFAFNLSLSQWQSLIGPSLVEHIVNPKGGSIYGFNFLPGPLASTVKGDVAYLFLTYHVSNVTSVNQTAPRILNYSLKRSVFNFQHAASGEVLGNGTTLNIVIPPSAKIASVYPAPDSPQFGFANSYSNVTTVSWFENEPLSNFVLTFTIKQSLQEEVDGFFHGIYDSLGWLSYIIIIVIVAAVVFYVYVRMSQKPPVEERPARARKRKAGQ